MALSQPSIVHAVAKVAGAGTFLLNRGFAAIRRIGAGTYELDLAQQLDNGFRVQTAGPLEINRIVSVTNANNEFDSLCE